MGDEPEILVGGREQAVDLVRFPDLARIVDRLGEIPDPAGDVVRDHALVDGVHAGRWYERVQAYLDAPEAFLA